MFFYLSLYSGREELIHDAYNRFNEEEEGPGNSHLSGNHPIAFLQHEKNYRRIILYKGMQINIDYPIPNIGQTNESSGYTR